MTIVDHLRLTVCLRVERRAQADLDTGHLKEVVTHVTGEDWTKVFGGGESV
jgi:hypothetical protein